MKTSQEVTDYKYQEYDGHVSHTVSQLRLRLQCTGKTTKMIREYLPSQRKTKNEH